MWARGPHCWCDYSSGWETHSAACLLFTRLSRQTHWMNPSILVIRRPLKASFVGLFPVWRYYKECCYENSSACPLVNMCLYVCFIQLGVKLPDPMGCLCMPSAGIAKQFSKWFDQFICSEAVYDSHQLLFSLDNSWSSFLNLFYIF